MHGILMATTGQCYRKTPRACPAPIPGASRRPRKRLLPKGAVRGFDLKRNWVKLNPKCSTGVTTPQDDKDDP